MAPRVEDEKFRVWTRRRNEKEDGSLRTRGTVSEGGLRQASPRGRGRDRFNDTTQPRCRGTHSRRWSDAPGPRFPYVLVGTGVRRRGCPSGRTEVVVTLDTPVVRPPHGQDGNSSRRCRCEDPLRSNRRVQEENRVLQSHPETGRRSWSAADHMSSTRYLLIHDTSSRALRHL